MYRVTSLKGNSIHYKYLGSYNFKFLRLIILKTKVKQILSKRIYYCELQVLSKYSWLP